MLHFAPRFGMISPCLNWGRLRLRAMRVARPANDNGAALPGRKTGANDTEAHDEAVLAAALRLFAAHGLSAAQRAGEAAEIAAAGGDSAGAAWWVAVCAMLDGPMAKALERAFAARATSQR
ncbi:hypothetical protein AQZ52_15755 [Novosphingobium fuchskuhlense]|uniref:Uncharacterized protein n=1 Tax=Novosphingobium fuchskuhlense TaxID=1117702 RepID=A0A117UT11_9SPHN|nr:hypothetical protein [Novosphingobium fuchskuhlense]KUR70304.1 hypothetical protein AQZ52_15755 [Novosphingobium fuchskuhlense]